MRTIPTFATVSVASLVILARVGPALAQDSAPVTVEVGECLEIESPEERLACYEKRVDAALQEGPAPAAELPRPSSDPGAVDAAQAPQSGQKTGRPTEILSTITALRETVPSAYLITLENGQVWRQMRPKTYPLRVGHEVRIYPTGWGSAYRLTVEELNSFIQVERVR